MKNIPFDISLRPEIESGRYRVELANGHTVRILAWDLPGDYPIAAADWPIDCESDTRVETYNENGWDGIGEFKQDLWLIDTEEEMTDWEEAVYEQLLWAHSICDLEQVDAEVMARQVAEELLEAARKELQKESAYRHD